MSSNKSSSNYLAVPGANMNMDGGSDAPSPTRSTRSSGQGSHHGSHSGSHRQGFTSGSKSGSRTGSVSGAPQHPNFPATLGYDPARLEPKKKELNLPKNLDLPPEAYAIPGQGLGSPLPVRPGFNTTGQDCRVQVNQFRVTKLSSGDVYQYSVELSPTPKGPGLIKKLWNLDWVKARIAEKHRGTFIFDGRALAWSAQAVSEIRFTVDFGALRGKKKPEVYYLIIKPSTKIRMAAIQAYVQGKSGWDNSILEGLNFLDHVIRQGPSENMIAQKRSFFHPQANTHMLSQGCLEAIKGIYASVRLSNNLQSGGGGVGINVDTTNCAFYIGQDFEQLVRAFLGNFDRKWQNMQYPDMIKQLAPTKVTKPDGTVFYQQSEAFKALRKLQRIKFTIKHRGKQDDKTVYTANDFVWMSVEGGGNAKNQKFDLEKPDGTKEKISVYDYFQRRYNIKLRWWQLPLIKTNKAGDYPMELCSVERYNRYPFKLNPNETSEMIKFAVQRPGVRKNEIIDNVKLLNWGGDRYLKEFGVQVDTNLPVVPAKVIKNPEIQFAGSKINPLMSGRWDLRNKKFILPNKTPLRSWAFAVLDSCCDKPTVDNFIKAFCTAYKGHGGRIERQPMVYNFSPNQQHSDIVEQVYKKTGQAQKESPQIVFFILKDKTAWMYERMKKNADCRFALLTQMVQVAHVKKAQPQYCSNVCMKVNAKLGGQTARIPSVGASSPFFKVPTMIIGCDVSHASPGSQSASMASVTVSMDKDAAVYYAACQSNGFRVEILTPANMHLLLPPLLTSWKKKNGTVPSEVFYIRDGVSEGQFLDVIRMELDAMKDTFKETLGVVPKFTVIIAVKRHHVRFFPEKGDKNGNPMPGTLVEREVANPIQYSFFLNSHVALQGTARPVHYHVIHDEIKWKVDYLQKMLYHQCYAYMRATTPVSVHPAAYYAHLASARARAHESLSTSQQVPAKHKLWVMQPGPMAKMDNWESASTARREESEALPLLPLGGDEARADMKENFRNTMWFI